MSYYVNEPDRVKQSTTRPNATHVICHHKGRIASGFSVCCVKSNNMCKVGVCGTHCDYPGHNVVTRMMLKQKPTYKVSFCCDAYING